MKIAIYGVSRSGKDYFIGDLITEVKNINNGLEAIHINGSKTLNELSLDKYSKSFKMLSELEKESIRKDFIKYVNNYDNDNKIIIVDGHYAFFDENMKFKRVFTEYDLNFYDYFFYLDSKAEDIVDRMRKSTGDKKNDVYTVDDIIEWKNYEVDNMTDELLQIDKELHIIKYENKLVFEYLFGVINGIYDSRKIAKKILENVDLGNNNSAILVDCDKTLSFEDTTNTLLKAKGIDSSIFKTIYKYDRYSNYQLLEAKKFYEECKPFDENSLSLIENKITYNTKLIADLKTKSNTKLIAVTAGHNEICQALLDKVGLNIDVLNSNLIMSKYVKYFVMRELQDRGMYVIAIGDSILDSLMLRFANKSYIIANKGWRANINQLLLNNRQIHQLSYNNYLYDNVTVDESIDSIKCLNYKDENIANQISICKSDSGVEGKKLRAAHYTLGTEIAKVIENDYQNEKFAVIIMMRSGLCFGQGIADYFDCPELFYDDSNIEKFNLEFYNNELYKDRYIILVDGVINSGKSMKEIIAKMAGYKTIIATNVISSKFNVDYIHPIYATRISSRSFVGAKQQIISNGKGPDTSDRLFRNM